MPKRRQKGFTLIELMIVVGIMALLASLAMYNYNRYGFRARRAEGRELAMRIAAAEERYFTNFNAYTDDFAKLKLTGGDKSDNGYYLATINVPAGNLTFTVTATPQAGQAKDQCNALTVNNTGFKSVVSPSNTSNGACW
jgi:type IV pilus assembly protein PilE